VFSLFTRPLARAFAGDSSENPVMKPLSSVHQAVDARILAGRQHGWGPMPTLQAGTSSYSCLHLTLNSKRRYYPHFTDWEIINFAKNRSKLLTLPKTEPQLPQRSSINVDPAVFKANTSHRHGFRDQYFVTTPHKGQAFKGWKSLTVSEGSCRNRKL